MPSEAFTGRASLLYLFDSGVAPVRLLQRGLRADRHRADLRRGLRLGPGASPSRSPATSTRPASSTSRPGTDILLTAAFFDIRRSNATTTDPVNPGFVVQTGEVGVQGVEFEARANLAEGLSLIGGFSLLDIRNVRDTGFTTNDLTRRQVPLQGLRPVQVPDTTASLFVDYRFTDGPLLGLGLGGGVRYLGPSWGDPANTFKVPESVLVDAVASYDMKHLDPTAHRPHARRSTCRTSSTSATSPAASPIRAAITACRARSTRPCATAGEAAAVGKTFRQSMAWLHAWSGLVVGWVLFAVFVTGTASYYRAEISQWMRPELRTEPRPSGPARSGARRPSAASPTSRRRRAARGRGSSPCRGRTGRCSSCSGGRGRARRRARSCSIPTRGAPAALRDNPGRGFPLPLPLRTEHAAALGPLDRRRLRA